MAAGRPAGAASGRGAPAQLAAARELIAGYGGAAGHAPPDTPLLHFLSFFMEALARRSADLAALLLQRYRPALDRDPALWTLVARCQVRPVCVLSLFLPHASVLLLEAWLARATWPGSVHAGRPAVLGPPLEALHCCLAFAAQAAWPGTAGGPQLKGPLYCLPSPLLPCLPYHRRCTFRQQRAADSAAWEACLGR